MARKNKVRAGIFDYTPTMEEIVVAEEKQEKQLARYNKLKAKYKGRRHEES